MRVPLRRLLLTIFAGTAVAVLAGCAGMPSASRPPTPTPHTTATATPPALGTPTTAPVTPTPASGPAAAPTPTSAPVPAATPMPGGTPSASFPWPSGTPTVDPGQVEFGLLVTGTPAPGEELDLYFQAPHVGQNEFQLCGPANPCRAEPGQVYTWGSRNIPGGTSPWAFQERLGGTTTTIDSGTLDATQGAVITATVSR